MYDIHIISNSFRTRIRFWGLYVKYIVGKMIGTKHSEKNKNICTLSILIQPNLDAIKKKKITRNSTSKIKTPDKLIKFLLCFLLLNENFKVGIVPSGDIVETLKYSSEV